MKHCAILHPPIMIDLPTWRLSGEPITQSTKRLSDLSGIFHDTRAAACMDPSTLIYQVQAYMPVAEGTEGGLFFGTTVIEPGRIGDEYFMTRGHVHARADCGEFYWGVAGEGMLIVMNPERETWAEPMHPGSLHYITAHTAHRVANTGSTRLIFGASWPSDAGHNYATIARDGFSARCVDDGGTPTLIPS